MSEKGAEKSVKGAEQRTVTRFLFEVSEAEYESIIKAGRSTQDEKHARSKKGGFLDKRIPSQELQQGFILLNAH
ncbi:hypothetical protein F2Q69_00042677 [Brassica cretica]|uniref:Uncharacterized protein n=1 Tax=Brassica cretica TaxID=69181 RepID=A0A8S9NMZ8_BRACR|nr:hypothetical protein F2Q69_00042677 [Brassica cretica]